MSTGFERDPDEFTRGARAVVVYPDMGGSSRDADARLEETAGLALAIGVQVVEKTAFRLRQPKPGTLIGSGQVEALAETVRDSELQLAVFDAALTPIQQRNLETALGCKVIDRTGLIRDRMARLRRELEQVSRTRTLHRDRRQRAPWPVIALVGYTNAGKSTLFNRLTGSDVMAENLLFATLDPTLRQISLPGIDKAILSDTVGFVSELPTQLVAAFKATLEEVVSADLLIHVRDVAHPDSEAQRADVEKVLEEIGVSPETPRFEAWNKLDLLDEDRRAQLLEDAARHEDVMPISALTGEGVEVLVERVAARLTEGHRRYTIALDPADGAGAAWLHQHGEVLGQSIEGEQAVYEVRMAPRDYERFETRKG